jgi:hypothetical protein
LNSKSNIQHSTSATQSRIHLVTYATGIFLLRQWFLGKSALANKVVDTVTNWTPAKLTAAGFGKRAPEISLRSRGSGYWAWKPFIIEHQLAKVNDGDIVLYCDVGRRNDFKLLDRSLAPFIAWMDEHKQDVMPGVMIPWMGPMSAWTKRDAFVFTNMDTPEAHATTPIQASFSLWRASAESRALATRWMDLCAQARLINDDKSASGLPELPGVIDHRHDQSLLTLCCLSLGVKALDLGKTKPPVDTQYPSKIAEWLFNTAPCEQTNLGKFIKAAVWLPQMIELNLRRIVSIGHQGPPMPK